MTDDFPDNAADEDGFPPPPPDAADDDVGPSLEPDAEAEPAIVPVPSHTAAAPTLAVPRARRELKVAHEAVKAAMTTLTKLTMGEQVKLDAIAVDALICGAYDRQYPIGDTARINQLRERALDGELSKYAPLALDELEDVITALEAAQAALKAASLLGEPIPATWGNLHPVLLARKLNGLGHTLLRGRIAGVNL